MLPIVTKTLNARDSLSDLAGRQRQDHRRGLSGRNVKVDIVEPSNNDDRGKPVRLLPSMTMGCALCRIRSGRKRGEMTLP